MQISSETQDGITHINMDDGKLNVITLDAAQELLRVIRAAEQSSSAIVLSGRTGSFCAGFDKAIMTGMDDEARAALSLAGAHVARQLFTCPKPVVAASAGHAFTIGALWLMACDTRIGERGDFKYAMTETVMGAALSGWPLAILESRVPPRLMTAIAVQSQVLGPDDAVEAGYLDQVVPPGDSISAALEAAGRLARLPQETYAKNKLAVRQVYIERLSLD